MVLGVIGSSPNDIAKLGGLYFGINPNYLANISESKADTTIGLLLLSASFCIQIFLHIYGEKLTTVSITRNKVKVFIVSSIVTVLIILFFRQYTINNTIYQTHKEMAYLDLEQQFIYNMANGPTVNNKVLLTEGQVKQIKAYMEILNFKKKNNESNEKYFERFCDKLGHEFCSQIDFKESTKNI